MRYSDLVIDRNIYEYLKAARHHAVEVYSYI